MERYTFASYVEDKDKAQFAALLDDYKNRWDDMYKDMQPFIFNQQDLDDKAFIPNHACINNAIVRVGELCRILAMDNRIALVTFGTPDKNGHYLDIYRNEDLTEASRRHSSTT